MSLWFTLHVNAERLDTVEIQRCEHLDLTDQAGIQNAVSTYDVRRDGVVIGQVRHRYGAGRWKLLALATALIAERDEMAEAS